MPYIQDLHEYLHQSSLLIKAYPSTRITTKYSLPRKPKPKAKTQSKTSTATTDTDGPQSQIQQKREPAATLVLKTYHPDSGICLKYKTDKAAEVGRLMTGLGKLARGEIIEIPSATAVAAAAAADKMELDTAPTAAQTPAQADATAAASGSGKSKKKKGRK